MNGRQMDGVQRRGRRLGEPCPNPIRTQATKSVHYGVHSVIRAFALLTDPIRNAERNLHVNAGEMGIFKQVV